MHSFQKSVTIYLYFSLRDVAVRNVRHLDGIAITQMVSQEETEQKEQTEGMRESRVK